MTRIAIAIATSLLATALKAASPAVDDPGQHPLIQTFLNACAVTYAHAAGVADFAKANGFDEIRGGDAESYLGGQSGRVWRGQIAGGTYAIALNPNGLCSVVAHQGDAKQVLTAVESWLPPRESGISVTKQTSDARDDKITTSYQLRGAEVREQWVVTISSNPASRIRAILSWNRLPAA
jgi:hypothetical protein